MSFLIIDGREISVKDSMVDLGLIDLDQRNPRLASVPGVELMSHESLTQTLLGLPRVLALKRAISQNGGLIEPVILMPNGERFTVYEGNCRVSCLTELSKTDPKYSRVPAKVLDSTFKNSDRASLLSCLHVASKIGWSAFDKAKFINEMVSEHKMSKTAIATHLRIAPKKLEIFLNAFSSMELFLKNNPGEKITSFSYFYELFNNRDLSRMIVKDPFFVERFGKWVAAKKFTNWIEVRLLPAILDAPIALTAFESSGIEAASGLIKKEKIPSIVRSLRGNNERIKNLSGRDFDAIVSSGERALKVLITLQRETGKLIARINEQREDDGLPAIELGKRTVHQRQNSMTA